MLRNAILNRQQNVWKFLAAITTFSFLLAVAIIRRSLTETAPSMYLK